MEGSFLAAQPCQNANGCSWLFLWPELTLRMWELAAALGAPPQHHPGLTSLEVTHLLLRLHTDAQARARVAGSTELTSRKSAPSVGQRKQNGKMLVGCGVILWHPGYGLRLGATFSSPCSPAHRTSSSREYPPHITPQAAKGTGLSHTEPLEPARSEQVQLWSSGAWSSPVGASGSALLRCLPGELPVPPGAAVVPNQCFSL